MLRHLSSSDHTRHQFDGNLRAFAACPNNRLTGLAAPSGECLAATALRRSQSKFGASETVQSEWLVHCSHVHRARIPTRPSASLPVSTVLTEDLCENLPQQSMTAKAKRVIRQKIPSKSPQNGSISYVHVQPSPSHLRVECTCR